MSKKPTTRAYTATMILDTRGLTDTVDILIGKLREVITSVQAEVSGVENHGPRDFARAPSRAYPNGVFVTFKFSAPVTAPAALREKLRLDRTVNRLIVQSA